MEWKSVTELEPHQVSTPEKVYRLIIWLDNPGNDEPSWREGWYFGGGLREWRQAGSNTEVYPTHFIDVTPPTTKS